MRIPVFLTIFCLCMEVSVHAGELTPGESGVVAAVSSGDTLRLSDGVVVRLVGLQAPRLPLESSGFPAWPMAPESRDALKALVLGRTVSLFYGGVRRDRHGRALAQLYRADGLWVQGAMIRAGLARVYSFADNRACVTELLALETTARAARRGLWALDAYQLLDPDTAFRGVGGFQIVEGRVRAAQKVRAWIYLNFGADWRTDFTVSIAVKDQGLFKQQGWDLLALSGQQVRVRGWMDARNGPHIQLTHPEQMERLSAGAPRLTDRLTGCATRPE